MGDITRPAWNAWAAQNAENLRAQSYGAGVSRQQGLIYRRDDARDLVAGGKYVGAIGKAAINDVAALIQLSPQAFAFRAVTGTEAWQPFEMKGALNEAGEITFQAGSLLLAAGEIPSLARGAKALFDLAVGRLAPEISRLGVGLQSLQSRLCVASISRMSLPARDGCIWPWSSASRPGRCWATAFPSV